jgi:pimeloyl-ACP methyl ester carboxylesterase
MGSPVEETYMKKRLLWIVPLVLVLALAGAFVLWASNSSDAMPEAEAALQSTSTVTVSTDPWLVFMPTSGKPDTGLIFYPGGKVDPVAYAPAAQAIANQGYLVVIPPMPLNLAVFGINKAQDIMDAYPDIQYWAIGGHSLGGSMAANFANKNRDVVDGLFFWGSYPGNSDNLSDSSLQLSSISASLDGLSTPDKIAASRPLLPADTAWLEIQGGNHAQFGYYGDQKGDNPATISREDQQAQVVDATLALLMRLKP